MDAVAELALVRKAIESSLSNCCEWVSAAVQNRVRNDPELQGLTPRGVKQLLKEWVKDQGGAIVQKQRDPAGTAYDSERCL